MCPPESPPAAFPFDLRGFQRPPHQSPPSALMPVKSQLAAVMPVCALVTSCSVVSVFAPPVTKRAIALGFAAFVTSRRIAEETDGFVFKDADFPRLRRGGIIFGDAFPFAFLVTKRHVALVFAPLVTNRRDQSISASLVTNRSEANADNETADCKGGGDLEQFSGMRAKIAFSNTLWNFEFPCGFCE